VADVLAGESSANEVDIRTVLAFPPLHSGAYIVMFRNVRPVLRQHLTAERVDLDLADNGHPSPLQTEFQTADTSEQR